MNIGERTGKGRVQVSTLDKFIGRKRLNLIIFSLYGLLNRTRSKVGGRMLRRWMLKPLYHPEIIQERLDTLEYLVSTENAELVLSAVGFCLRN